MGNAAMVWDRFPGPSWKSSTAPGRRPRTARRTTSPTPGLRQSSESFDHVVVAWKVREMAWKARDPSDPYGGRTQTGRTPVAAMTAWSVRTIWLVIAAGDKVAKAG